MTTPKAPTAAARTALQPQRRPGKLRVAALLRSAAQVIAERGFEAATMAEIAARAGAPVGSLYRFFPTKDVLADALIERYLELIGAAFSAIDSRREGMTTETFADALLDTMHGMRGETQAAIAELLQTRGDSSQRHKQFHDTYVHHIVQALRRRDAALPPARATAMAIALLQNMKAVKSFDVERDAAAIAELRTMTRLYLSAAFGE